jgi:peroxiredoxin (alkyl hydroperoxide reductase subunit C)
MADEPQGCARVTGAVLGENPPDAASDTTTSPREIPEERMIARVGYKAPDFNAPAYYKGDFTSIQLSDFFGKWILLCFYPGDFTFV